MHRIRGHHLLCIQGFQGLGYSDGFINNLSKIKKELEDENPEIIVVDHCDDICQPCPYCIEGKCELYGIKVELMDKDVLKTIKMEKDEKVKFKEALKSVKTGFSTKEGIDRICKDCTWIDKCLFYNSFE